MLRTLFHLKKQLKQSICRTIYSGILRQKKKSGQHAVKGKECDHSSIKLNTTLYTHTTMGIFFRQVFLFRG